MTISPVAAPVAVAASGGTSGGSADTDFAALVRQHLADGSAGQGADERSGGVSGEAAAAMLEAASAPSAVPSEGLAALLAGLLAGPAAGDASGTSTADRLEGDAASTHTTTSGGTARGAGLPEVIPGASALIAGGLTGSGLAQARLVDGTAAGALGGSGMIGAAGTLVAGPASVDSDGGNAGRNLAGAPGDDMLGEALGGTTATIGGGAAGAGATGSADVSAASTGGATATDGPGGSAPTIGSGAAPAASAAGAGAGEAASNGFASNPITDQVFGQVTRLVSRGDGTHRLTLRLHPADLGEVKVVLTVKDGAVDVTLSAGAAARDALREGSPQLRALLELAGASTGQVTVRDLATGAVTSSTQAGQQQPAGTGADQQRSANSDSASADGMAEGTAGGEADGGTDGQTESQAGAGLGSEGERLGSGSQDGSSVAAATEPAATPHGSTASSRPTTPHRLDLNI